MCRCAKVHASTCTIYVQVFKRPVGVGVEMVLIRCVCLSAWTLVGGTVEGCEGVAL